MTLSFLNSYMGRLCFVIVFYVSGILAFGQNVKIAGSANHHKNEEIELFAFNDYISCSERKITSASIDSLGNFVLDFNSKGILYVTLKAGKDIASMYTEPGGNYEVILDAPDSTTYQNPNLEHDVKISINIKSKTEINALTIDYDKRFDDFLTKKYTAFVRRNAQPQIDTFKQAMHEFYSTVQNTFFDAYITYSIATLEEKTERSRKKLFTDYINGKPILYNHPEYMNFFSTFYKQTLQGIVSSKGGNDVLMQIENRNSFKGLMSTLKLYNYLENDTIRELVVIKGLSDGYYDGTFKRATIINLLQQVVTETTIPEHQHIAQNILNSFSKLQPGEVAPGFELPDKTGRTHSLDELRNGKYVYLMFYDATITSCLQQMKVIAALKKQYGSKINFVSISSDKTNAELATFSAKNPKYDWQFLYDNSGLKLKENYEVKILPAYFLIAPDGQFVQVPADSPEENIEQVFYEITKHRDKKPKIGDRKNH